MNSIHSFTYRYVTRLFNDKYRPVLTQHSLTLELTRRERVAFNQAGAYKHERNAIVGSRL